MKTEEQEPSKQAKRSVLPSRHDEEAIQTIILLGCIVGVAAAYQNGFSGMHEEMDAMRQEMRAMRAEIRGEILSPLPVESQDMNGLHTARKSDSAELRTDLRRLDDRTQSLEAAAAANCVRLDNLERVVFGTRGLAEAVGPGTNAGPCERLAQGR